MGCLGIHLRAVSLELLKVSLCKMSLKISLLKFQPHLLEANKLTFSFLFPREQYGQVHLIPIASSFDLRVVAAPAITYTPSPTFPDYKEVEQVDGLMQKRCNFSALVIICIDWCKGDATSCYFELFLYTNWTNWWKVKSYLANYLHRMYTLTLRFI